MKRKIAVLLTEGTLFFLLSSCSVWQSEGRKFLEQEGLEFAAQGATSFKTYLEKKCVPQQPHQLPAQELVLTGRFKLHISETTNTNTTTTTSTKDTADTTVPNDWYLYSYGQPDSLQVATKGNHNSINNPGFFIHYIYLESSDQDPPLSLFCKTLVLGQPQMQVTKQDIITLIQTPIFDSP